MKTRSNHPTKRNKLAVLAALAGLLFTPVGLRADDGDEIEKVKIKDGKVKVKGEDGKVKIKPDGTVKVKGDADEELAVARAALSAEERAEFKTALVEGYVVPEDRYVYLEPVPETYVTRLDPVPEGHVYRYFDGTVYTIHPETYTVVSVTSFDD